MLIQGVEAGPPTLARRIDINLEQLNVHHVYLLMKLRGSKASCPSLHLVDAEQARIRPTWLWFDESVATSRGRFRLRSPLEIPAA